MYYKCFQDLYESIDKKSKLENENLKREGLELMTENVLYKYTVDGMAKHIVYGNTNVFILNYRSLKLFNLLMILIL